MVKKSIRNIIIATSVTALFFSGCAKKNIAPSEQERVIYKNPKLEGAPAWVFKPQVPGKVAGIGSAPPNAAGDIGFQREEAMANARDYIAREIQVKVGNMIKSFKSATGSGADATFDKAVESVSKQVASQTLSGTVLEDTWQNREGTLFVLVVIDTKNIKDAMEKSIKTSFKNDKALYQKFLAAKANKELDKELEKFNQ